MLSLWCSSLYKCENFRKYISHPIKFILTNDTLLYPIKTFTYFYVNCGKSGMRKTEKTQGESSLFPPHRKYVKLLSIWTIFLSLNTGISYGIFFPFQVEWSPVLPHQDLVFPLANGSLLFYPFSAEKYRHEIHSTVYR